MSIKINQNIKIALSFLLASEAIAFMYQKCTESRINEIKTELKTKASPKHFKYMEQQTEQMGISAQEIFWQKSRRSVIDSLKIDSIAKKAYFEGAQMVRDSIANSK
mgnify:CR=1 FL=1